jgi:hypothetical protein
MSGTEGKSEAQQGSPEIRLKEKELRLSFWTNTILIGVLGGILTIVVSLLDVRQKQADLVHRQHELSVTTGELEFKLVGEPLQRIIRDPCAADAQQSRKYLNVILNTGIIEGGDKVGRYEEIARNLTESCPSTEPTGKCLAVKAIREIGWRSGHKTNFCIARNFDGVWNLPNSSYSSGGYCYTGDSAKCRAEIEAGRKN